MILHITYDQLFIDNVITLCEEAHPNSNYYIILSKNELPLKRIKLNHPNLFIIQRKHFKISVFLKKNPDIRSIVIHCLTPAKAEILLSASRYVKTTWMFWGAEFYRSDVHSNLNLFGEKTKALSNSITKKSLLFNIKTKVLNLLFFLTHSFNTPGQIIKKAILTSDYCAPVIYEDYLLLKSTFPQFKAEYVAFNYGTLEQFLGLYIDKRINGNNILIGNSATKENNHLEAFEIIKSLISPEQQVITPLSYGDKDYKEKVISIGRIKFQNTFYPLTEFLPIDEYISILSSCGIVIMNHKRQQALGNIIASIWMGAKVFLNENTTTWQFFKRIGVHVFSIEKDLCIENKFLNNPLTENQIMENRHALTLEYSHKSVLNKTKRFIEILDFD